MEVSTEKSIRWLVTVLLAVVKSAAQEVGSSAVASMCVAPGEPVDVAPSYRLLLLFGSRALTGRHSLTSSSLSHSESCISAK